MARIGIDLDGVCYNFEESVRRFLMMRYGYPRAALPNPTGWHIDQQWGMTRKQFQDYCHQGVDEGIIFLTGSAYPGTAEGISLLREAGHSIHINTARDYGSPGASALNTSKWLAREGISYETLTFAQDKTIVRADYMLDDRLSNYDALVHAGVRAVLYDQPWNQDEKGGPQRVRVKSMLDFVACIGYYEALRKNDNGLLTDITSRESEIITVATHSERLAFA